MLRDGNAMLTRAACVGARLDLNYAATVPSVRAQDGNEEKTPEEARFLRYSTIQLLSSLFGPPVPSIYGSHAGYESGKSFVIISLNLIYEIFPISFMTEVLSATCSCFFCFTNTPPFV